MSEVFREIALKVFAEEDNHIEEDEVQGVLENTKNQQGEITKMQSFVKPIKRHKMEEDTEKS